MGNVNSIPIISQCGSLVDVLSGDVDRARQRQEHFSRRCPIVSQARSLVEACMGDEEAARTTQLQCAGELRDFAEGAGLIGATMGVVHHASGNHEAGNRCLEATARTLAVTAGGMAGGAAGAVAAGVAVDAAASGIDGQPHGTLAGVCHATDSGAAGDWFDASASVALDALSGRGGRRAPRAARAARSRERMTAHVSNTTDAFHGALAEACADAEAVARGAAPVEGERVPGRRERVPTRMDVINRGAQRGTVSLIADSRSGHAAVGASQQLHQRWVAHVHYAGVERVERFMRNNAYLRQHGLTLANFYTDPRGLLSPAAAPNSSRGTRTNNSANSNSRHTALSRDAGEPARRITTRPFSNCAEHAAYHQLQQLLPDRQPAPGTTTTTTVQNAASVGATWDWVACRTCDNCQACAHRLGRVPTNETTTRSRPRATTRQLVSHGRQRVAMLAAVACLPSTMRGCDRTSNGGEAASGANRPNSSRTATTAALVQAMSGVAPGGSGNATTAATASTATRSATRSSRTATTATLVQAMSGVAPGGSGNATTAATASTTTRSATRSSRTATTAALVQAMSGVAPGAGGNATTAATASTTRSGSRPTRSTTTTALTQSMRQAAWAASCMMASTAL